jgi:hypothetical protein
LKTVNVLGEREKEKVGGGERHYNRGGGNNTFGLKVPRHCQLVLLIGVRLEYRINSTFFNFKAIEVGGAALELNLVQH